MDTQALIKSAISLAGSETSLAQKAGCSQAAINKCKKLGRVSPQMAVRLEKAVGIPRHVWRPDMWPLPPAKSEAAA